MNTYLLKEAVKLALMSASIDGQKFESNDALSELIIEFYDDIEAFARALQFTPVEIENMDKATAVKLVSKYID